MPVTDDLLKEYLRELTALTENYGFIIGGCGCCGSPYLFHTDDNVHIWENLDYDESEGYNAS